MKTICVIFCLLSTLGSVTGDDDYDLDDWCGKVLWLDSSNGSRVYGIRDRHNFQQLCNVVFHTLSTDTLQLTIAGSDLSPTECAVNVFDADNIESRTGGDIREEDSFTKVIQADSTGQLNLHIQGDECDLYNVTVKTQLVTSCSAHEFTCNDGQCVWDDNRCNGFSDCYDQSDEESCGWSVSVFVGIGSVVILFVILVVMVVVVSMLSLAFSRHQQRVAMYRC